MKTIPSLVIFLTLLSGSLVAQDERISSPPIPNQAAPDSQPEEKPAEPKEKPGEKPGEEKKAAVIQAKPVVNEEYVVQSGDNPWVIAKNHGIHLRALLAVNKIEDAKQLKVGDVLKLPEGVESKNKPAVPTPVADAGEGKTEATTEEGEWELYTIEKGDNPWKIAKTLDVNHQEIVKLNQGLDFTKLSIGQQIKVPKKK